MQDAVAPALEWPAEAAGISQRDPSRNNGALRVEQASRVLTLRNVDEADGVGIALLVIVASLRGSQGSLEANPYDHGRTLWHPC
jgi:hypothetical protein